MQKISSQALIPQIIGQVSQKVIAELITFTAGVLLISLLAQLAVPLPWTPVPLTGQTLGVTLVALSWGQKRALSVIVGYLLIGALGLPIFALGKSGLSVGPTLGYLIGMVLSSYLVGSLADKGFTNTFKKTLFAAFAGSAIVFTFGLIGLSFFVPKNLLLTAGLLPFIPGDIIKNTIASFISFKIKQKT